jgi:hypothetical protein
MSARITEASSHNDSTNKAHGNTSPNEIKVEEVTLVNTHTKYSPLSECCSNFPHLHIAGEGGAAESQTNKTSIKPSVRLAPQIHVRL